MDIVNAFTQAISAMSDVEFENLLDSVRVLRDASEPVDDYLARTTPTSPQRQEYTYGFIVSEDYGKFDTCDLAA